MKVLVTNGRYKGVLAILRSLGKEYNVTAIDTKKYHSSYFSRYCKRTGQTYSNPNFNDQAFIRDILTIVKDREFDVLLPIGADTTIPISFSKSLLTPFIKVPVADYKILKTGHDKEKCLEYAKKAGVPVPKTWVPKNEDELRYVAEDVHYPVVIKIRKGGAARGLRYARNPDELIEKYREPYPPPNLITDYSRPLIQEYVPGDIYDVCTLFNHGEHVVSLAQRRVYTYPYKGGAGIANITVEYPELIEMTKRLLEKMKWHGVAEVEYKLDKDFNPVLMEVNSKFWGTLGLSIEAGVNFPKLLCDMAMGYPIHATGYRRGVRMMWVHPALSGHVRQSPDKLKSMGKLFNFWLKGAKLDVTFSDPFLSLVQIVKMIGGFFV